MLVKNLQDLAKEVTKYKEDLVKARKEAKQQDIIDAVNLMQTTTTCLQKSKETYFARCAELEKLRKEANVNPKEVSKMETKMSKSKEEYRAYVDKYETVRVDFEEKMEKACKMFQSHDRSHFAALQQFLLMYATHHQEAIIAAQQSLLFSKSHQIHRGYPKMIPNAKVVQCRPQVVLPALCRRIRLRQLPQLMDCCHWTQLTPGMRTEKFVYVLSIGLIFMFHPVLL
ncbi:hypothetical protein ANCCEY_07872 [Ancylostoma ceylanicum]|uniref:GMIP/FCHO2-like FCH domain-containing protein n=1 Tax=Ancylostoma ceylanicum TaxID=53326 RepID=A0A0D6LP72_9BILA|nr:hypothetical protein ANCCEY_07872 [Ancylostoma ceylanicum]